MNVIHKTVQLGTNVIIGHNVSIWDYSKIETGVSIGENTKIGRNVYIGEFVKIGSNCKIQNNSLIYSPAEIFDGVFIGPGVILTNDKNPRAIDESGDIKNQEHWHQSKIVVEQGASLGAGVICVAPIIVGSWSLSGSGAVLTANVPRFALMAGVPARQIGWVCKCGYRLEQVNQYSYKCDRMKHDYWISDDGIMSERLDS